MFCSQCGTIIGRDAPPDLFKCPRCSNVIKVQAFAVVDDVTAPRFVSFDGSKKRLVGLYVSEAMVRLQLSGRSQRASEWEALLVELEEERLKAFARRMGWLMSRSVRDAGPRAAEQDRPFGGLEQDLKEGLINTVLVSDFEGVPRSDLFRLWQLVESHGGVLVSVAPHRCDDNLIHDNIDYDSVPLHYSDNPVLSRQLNLDKADRIIEKSVDRFGWLWTYYVADLLAGTMGADAVAAWREEDPACKQQHWKEVLTYYAIARARHTGRVFEIPLPRLLACTACKRRFLDAAIPLHLAELSRYEAVYCRTCLSRAFFYDEQLYQHYVGPAPVDSVRDFEACVSHFQDMPRELFGAVVRGINHRRKAHEDKGVKASPSSVFLEVLAEEGGLDSHGHIVRSDSFFKAADGHLLAAYGTAVIDNYLTQREITHRLDVKYPRNIQLNPAATLRSDFLARNIHVEFLGLRGHDEFNKQTELRAELAKRNQLQVIGLYAEDLASPAVLERKCEPLLAANEDAQEEAR